VDVSQDVIIREEDCGTDRAIPMPIAQRDKDTGDLTRIDDALVVHEFAETSTHARTIADDIKDQSGNLVVARGTDLNTILVDKIVAGRCRADPRPQRSDLRVEAGCLRGLLRPFAADRQDRRRRRGGRHHRRPVDR
jgi:hypothetical protein